MSRERRRARRTKRQRAGEHRPRREQRAPSSVELATAETFERFIRYAQSSAGAEDASAAARADLLAAAEEISRAACGLDLIRVVSGVWVGMIMNRAVGGTEPSAAALELIALVLASRDATADVPVAPVESEFLPPRVEAAAQRALAAGSMTALFDSPPADAEGMILFHSVHREIMLRNPVYPHMLLDTLRGLFGDPAVNADCQAALGFTGLEAVNIMQAVRSLSTAQLAERFARMESARDASPPFLRSWQQRKESEIELPDQAHRAAAQKLFDAVQGLTTHIDEATVIDPDAVARRTGYNRATVEAVLDAYTLTGVMDIGDTLGRFFRGDNPLRTAPIISDAQGRRMLVHEALALPAVREVIENKLTAAKRWDTYKQHRGEWVENTAVDLLAGIFPGAKVYRAFNYFVPDPKAGTAQTDPVKFTKRVEGDGLIVIDDVALIVEVKAVALTPEARAGDPRRLRSKLRDIVTKAADQAGRLRERIITDKRVRLDDGQWIDASGVREIHTIAVGLEDLSGVTTATATLVAAGVLNPDNIPWTVSLHDLRIVSEILDRPSELLLYLRRRTQPETTWKYRAVDELDLFLLFLNANLHVEPDPRRTMQTLPWSGPPSTADLRRFNAEHPWLVDSHTEPLDAWYTSKIDPTATPADKPRLSADPKLLKLVDMVSKCGEPGWLPTTASLLEGNGKVQRRFGLHSADLAKLVRRDRKRHMITQLMPETSGTHILLVWACHSPDEEADDAAEHLSRYLKAKKHQTGFHRAAAMIFDPSGSDLLRLLYYNEPTEPDSQLDEDIAQLVPLQRMKRTVPRPGHQSKPR